MSNVFENTTTLTAALDAAMPDQRWLSILETFTVTGVADASQLQLSTALNRDKLSRALERLCNIFLNDAPLVNKLERTIVRPGQVKRPPNIYILAEGGAKLLREQGHKVRACELKEDIPILHALSMLSIHLAARRAGLVVETDVNIPYEDEKVFRPDHRIQLPDGRFLVMEVEQTANFKLLPRIKESIANRQAFFASDYSRGYLHEVRMVFNVRPGKDMRRSMNIWETAVKDLRDKTGEGLSYRIMVTPLETFLSAPEWGEKTTERFMNLELDSEQRFPLVGNDGEPQPLAIRQPGKGNLLKDVVILDALNQEFSKTFGIVSALPDETIFKLAETIYSASYGRKGTERHLIQVGTPVRSIYLFKEFLRMHADLRSKLKVVIHQREARMFWNQSSILHRMNQVAREFLCFFGWTQAMLDVQATTAHGKFGRTYSFTVSLFNFPFSFEESRYLAEALQWMLWALFEYADDLEIGRPEYW
jgi:hypothetical protein